MTEHSSFRKSCHCLRGQYRPPNRKLGLRLQQPEHSPEPGKARLLAMMCLWRPLTRRLCMVTTWRAKECNVFSTGFRCIGISQTPTPIVWLSLSQMDRGSNVWLKFIAGKSWLLPGSRAAPDRIERHQGSDIHSSLVTVVASISSTTAYMRYFQTPFPKLSANKN